MEKKLISVIIPVYNAEKYLGRCLDSIISQSYSNLEIILIDDCSKDNSLKICEEYAKKDRRIKIIKNEKNLGQAGARNKGIKQSKGDYITFVDNDDVIDLRMYETLLNDIVKNNVKIAGCATSLVFEDGASINNYNNKKSGIIKSDVLIRKILMHSNDAWGTVWNKLFSKELKKYLVFPIGKELEDYYVLINMYEEIPEAYFDKAPMYYWYQRNNSQSKRGYHDRINTLVDVSEEIKNKLNGKGFDKELAFFEYVNRYNVISAKFKSGDKKVLNSLKKDISEIERLNKKVRNTKSENRNTKKMIMKIKIMKVALLFK